MWFGIDRHGGDACRLRCGKFFQEERYDTDAEGFGRDAYARCDSNGYAGSDSYGNAGADADQYADSYGYTDDYADSGGNVQG